MAEVVLQDGETLESALRRFKRKVQQEDIIKEIKKHSFYLKPGEKRRTKEALARKRNRKKRVRDVEEIGTGPLIRSRFRFYGSIRIFSARNHTGVPWFCRDRNDRVTAGCASGELRSNVTTFTPFSQCSTWPPLHRNNE